MSPGFFINPRASFDFEKSTGMHGRHQKSLPDLYEERKYKRVIHFDDEKSQTYHEAIAYNHQPTCHQNANNKPLTHSYSRCRAPADPHTRNYVSDDDFHSPVSLGIYFGSAVNAEFRVERNLGTALSAVDG